MADISAADAIYQGGVNTALGNQDPDKVLATFPGNHNAALLWGEPKHRDAFVAKYGYDKAINMIDRGIAVTPGETKEERDWLDDIKKYKDTLLSKQNS